MAKTVFNVFVWQVLSVVWVAVAAPLPVRAGPEGARYYTCFSSAERVFAPIFYAFNGLLLGFGVYLAVETRKVVLFLVRLLLR